MQIEAVEVRRPRPARRHGRRVALVAEPPHPRPRARASGTRPCTDESLRSLGARLTREPGP